MLKARLRVRVTMSNLGSRSKWSRLLAKAYCEDHMGEQPAVVAKCWQLSRQPTTNAISNGNLGEARQTPIGRPGASSFHSQCTMSRYSATSIPYSTLVVALPVISGSSHSYPSPSSRQDDAMIVSRKPSPDQSSDRYKMTSLSGCGRW